MAASSKPIPKAAKGKKPVALLAFWGVVGVIALGGIATLQYLGPPPAPPRPKAAAQHGAPAQAAYSNLPPGAPIPAPNPALLAPSVTNPNWMVPRIGQNGMLPMHAYAASLPVAAGPQVAMLVAGLGDDDAQSQQAITSLPAAISLGITPYGSHLRDVVALSRATGHEMILEIPMQALNPAIENAGNQALVMAGPITLNQPMLDWNMAQFQGYAGVTDAIGATQGGGFMDNPSAKAWLLQQIAGKGLFFVDARQTGVSLYAWNRTADVVIDPIGNPQAETAQLASLAALAKMQGNALGILMIPTPNSVQMVQSWAESLPAQGIVLVPVSGLVQPPAAQMPAPPPSAAAAAAPPGQTATVTP